jgi:NADPH:quinone reductase-like Zn-dependent oxidoreductase
MNVRAVGVAAPGAELSVIERAVRDPGPSEVRIAVRAAAVNPTDLGLSANGVPDLPPPWTPGMDAAGVIDAVGPDVDRLSIGDAVMAAVMPRRPEGGAQAERIVVPAASVVGIPSVASFAEAATLPMNGLTAKLGLELLDVPSGGTLGVTGGAGLLASYVIPLARAAGLHVIADAAPDDAERVKALGAEVVPRGDFAPGLRAHAPHGADGVFDTALLHAETFGALRDGGALAVVRGWAPERTERGIEVRSVRVATVLERTDWLEELRAAADDGRLPLRVAGELPPERAAEAQRITGAGGLRGRIVIVF